MPELAVWMEHLDAVVAAVGDDEETEFVHAHAPRTTQPSGVVAFRAEQQQHLADLHVVAAATHEHGEWAVVDVLTSYRHRDDVVSLGLRSITHRVCSVLPVEHIRPVERALGTLYDDFDGIAPDHA